MLDPFALVRLGALSRTACPFTSSTFSPPSSTGAAVSLRPRVVFISILTRGFFLMFGLPGHGLSRVLSPLLHAQCRPSCTRARPTIPRPLHRVARERVLDSVERAPHTLCGVQGPDAGAAHGCRAGCSSWSKSPTVSSADHRRRSVRAGRLATGSTAVCRVTTTVLLALLGCQFSSNRVVAYFFLIFKPFPPSSAFR
jgi:hypothetical protein